MTPDQAAQAVNKAIRDGVLKRQHCAVCKRKTGKWGEPIQAHHCQYDKPLDVIWLCSKHHKCLHARLCRHNLQIGDSLQVLNVMKLVPEKERNAAVVERVLTSEIRHPKRLTLRNLVQRHHSPS